MPSSSRFSPIKRIIVDAGIPAMVGLGVAVKWSVHPDYCREDLTFDVLFGNAPNDTFKVLGTVQDVDHYIDLTNPMTADLQHYWYALRVKNDRGDKWYSDPQQAGSAWGKRNWVLARAIVRQETVRLKKGRAGTRGFLLRRKVFGNPCPRKGCIEPETGRVSDPNCPVCYGVGIDGGYYSPIEYWVDMNPDQVMRRLDPQQGPISTVIRTFRGLAYPPVNPRDIWVSGKSGIRYQVQERVTKVAQLEEEPLVLQFDVDEEPYGKVIYDYPVEAT